MVDKSEILIILRAMTKRDEVDHIQLIPTDDQYTAQVTWPNDKSRDQSRNAHHV